jgi:hypothetical protein
MAQEIVKDKKSLTAWMLRIEALCSQKGLRGEPMNTKARFILAVTMSAVMVLMVTLLVTYLNLGFRHDFLVQWIRAYFIAWPVAATTGFLVMPMARRVTDRLMQMTGG